MFSSIVFCVDGYGVLVAGIRITAHAEWSFSVDYECGTALASGHERDPSVRPE